MIQEELLSSGSLLHKQKIIWQKWIILQVHMDGTATKLVIKYLLLLTLPAHVN